MPTTVFMLLALWTSSKGWPRLHNWILDHPRFGPPLHQWQQQRAIPRAAKLAAGISMLASSIVIAFSQTNILIKVSTIVMMLVIFIWLVTRAEP